ncbi:MAG TPA: hypothetical protein PK239_18355, partial [Chitinophagales bacterium]|nr:hypothetical protein [Chitinophagales bacterium]
PDIGLIIQNANGGAESGLHHHSKIKKEACVKQPPLLACSYKLQNQTKKPMKTMKTYKWV